MKYLKLPKMKQREILAQIAEQLAGEWTEKITFTLPSPPADLPRLTIKFAPGVYDRMMGYVDSTATEIAWNGCVQRDKNTFTITKVFLYPQKVTGATVVTDDGTDEYGPYEKWVDSLDVDTYNTMRFQGHSHVNFGVTPSTTDTDAEAKRTRNLEAGDYYIFCIVNKKRDARWVIYDMATNILYEKTDKENDIDVITADAEMLKSIEEEKDEFLSLEGTAGKSDIFYLPEASKLLERYKIKTSEVWKTVPGVGYKKCHQLLPGETLSGKMRRRIIADHGVFIEDTTDVSSKIYPGFYGGQYSGSYGGRVYDYSDKDEGEFDWASNYAGKLVHSPQIGGEKK